jgi:hypothetical protein
MTVHRPLAVAAGALAIVVAAVVVTRLLSDSEEPAGWSSSGITLNTSSWDPGDDANDGLIVGVVRIDANGCLYLDSKWGDAVVNLVWPAGYTASRQPDGTVTITNPDGVVVAAIGHHLRAGGGETPAADTEFACRAPAPSDTAVMIQDELPCLHAWN